MSRITMDHIHDHLLKIQQAQDVQTALARRILHKVGKLMSIADDIKAALAEVAAETTAETDLITAIDTKITGLNDAIAALQQQVADLIAAGNGATAQDLQDIKDSVAAIKTGTDAVKGKLEITAGTPADQNA